MKQPAEALPYTSRQPAMSLGLTWIGIAALGLALLQVPWACGNFAAIPFPNTVTPREFVLLRAWSVAPALSSTLLACAALLPRRRGGHRTLAVVALAFTFVDLFLIHFATRMRAGE